MKKFSDEQKKQIIKRQSQRRAELNEINPETGKKYCFGVMDCFLTGDCSTCAKDVHNACYKKSFEGLGG